MASGSGAPGHPGAEHHLEAFVTAIAALPDRRFAFALGDGTVRLLASESPGEARLVEAHDGGCLALGLDLDGTALLSGGDDGRLVRITKDGDAVPLGRWAGKWIAAVAANRRHRLIAAAAGRAVHLLDAAGALIQTLEHPSTATDLAFDPSGQRLAVAHYGGVTLWIGYRDGWRPTLLPWAGSHIAVTWSPAGKFIVSSMQENALHGWRLADKKDMRMSGYPAKVRSMSWTARGRWLATAGAEAAVLWPFRTADGPMGKDPALLGEGSELVTAVAAHPARPLLAIGNKEGGVLLTRIEEAQSVTLVPVSGDPVSALCWSPDGGVLAIGTEGGRGLVLPLGR
jgi:WD40 repeat protein